MYYEYVLGGFIKATLNIMTRCQLTGHWSGVLPSLTRLPDTITSPDRPDQRIVPGFPRLSGRPCSVLPQDLPIHAGLSAPSRPSRRNPKRILCDCGNAHARCAKTGPVFATWVRGKPTLGHTRGAPCYASCANYSRFGGHVRALGLPVLHSTSPPNSARRMTSAENKAQAPFLRVEKEDRPLSVAPRPALHFPVVFCMALR